MKIFTMNTGFLLDPETPQDGFKLGVLCARCHNDSILSPKLDEKGHSCGVIIDLQQIRDVDKALGTTYSNRMDRIEELLHIESQYLGSRPIDIEALKSEEPKILPFKGNILRGKNHPEDLTFPTE